MPSQHSNSATVQLFSQVECATISDNLNWSALESAQTFSASKGQPLFRRRTSRVCDLHYDDRNAWIFERIYAKAKELNDDIWSFDITPPRRLQFVHYRFLNYHRSHMDSGLPSVSNRKISVSVQLSHSSDYLGGTLYAWCRNPERRGSKEIGSATFFPSHLWHKVTPVLWGQRLALVGWIEGEQPLR